MAAAPPPPSPDLQEEGSSFAPHLLKTGVTSLLSMEPFLWLQSSLYPGEVKLEESMQMFSLLAEILPGEI